MKKNNEIKGIIFDLGGVVIESFEFDFYKDANKKLRISPHKLAKTSEKEWGLIEIGKETNSKLWQGVSEKLGLGVASNKILATLWLKHYEQNAKIKKDTLAVIKQLRGDYTLGAISNTQKEHVAINRKRGLFQYFDVVILSSEVGFRKPQKEIFKLASKRMRIPFRHLLFIDDDIRWVRVAKKYGLKTILFKSSAQLKKDLKKRSLCGGKKYKKYYGH